MVCQFDCPSGMTAKTPVRQTESEAACVSSTACTLTRHMHEYWTPCYQNGKVQVWKYCNWDWGTCCT